MKKNDKNKGKKKQKLTRIIVADTPLIAGKADKNENLPMKKAK